MLGQDHHDVEPIADRTPECHNIFKVYLIKECAGVQQFYIHRRIEGAYIDIGGACSNVIVVA